MGCLVMSTVSAFFHSARVYAYDLSDNFSLAGTVAGAVQCESLDQGGGKADACGAALPFRPKLRFRPTEADEFLTEFGFAAGNGLNNISPFQLSPWAADLEDDVKDINGRGRNYLLRAWYRHDFRAPSNNLFRITLGLIDAADVLDLNAFANDPYTQFMNEAFVNSPQVFLPSYDIGTAIEWDLGPWSLRAIYMNVGKDEDEDEDAKVVKLTNKDISDAYNYVGVEIGYTLLTPFGKGNYRLVHSRTSRDFLDPTGSSAERRSAFALSFDQELGENLGAFLRIDAQSDQAAVDYDSYYAAGLDIRGRLWGRESDNIGLGLAHLNGGNLDLEQTRVAELYYRFVSHKQLALTADLQYMKDVKTSGKNPEGFIFGLRADLGF
jgi:hypothetical protein